MKMIIIREITKALGVIAGKMNNRQEEEIEDDN